MAADIFEEIVRLRREGVPTALATIVDTKGSTPGKLTQRMLVLQDGSIIGTVGGGCVEADVIRAARDVLDTGLARKMDFKLIGEEAERTGLACGGTLEIMVEPLDEPRLHVIGCGHVGAKVARLAKETGFLLTVMDDRPDYASKERFPFADDVVCAPFEQLEEALPLGPQSYLVIVTRGHQHDYDVTKWALGTDARFIGLVGSKSKRIQFARKLVEEGWSEDAMDRVQCPVGLPIGAEAPDEIAVSIVAALVARRRLGA